MEDKKRNGSKYKKSFISSIFKSFRNIGNAFPVLLGVILLFGLFHTFLPKSVIFTLFTGDLLRDTLSGAVIGSISAGNSITSYVIGGELLKDGVSLFAVSAFIVTWVTVGIVQLPAEAGILGKSFAIARNILSFIFAILISIATVITLTLIR